MRNAPYRPSRRSKPRGRTVVFSLACICLAALFPFQACGRTGGSAAQPPHRNFRHAEPPAVSDLRSSYAAIDAGIRVGYFGPFQSEHDTDTSAWLAAEMAREDVAGECLDGRILKLAPSWSDSPWTGGAAGLTDLIFRQQAVGIICGMDGEATHLAETLVAKAHIPLLSAVSTAKSVNLANVPWTFSVLPGDHLIAPRLAVRLAASARSLAVISGPDHDSRGFWQELRPHRVVDGAGNRHGRGTVAVGNRREDRRGQSRLRFGDGKTEFGGPSGCGASGGRLFRSHRDGCPGRTSRLPRIGRRLG